MKRLELDLKRISCQQIAIQLLIPNRLPIRITPFFNVRQPL